MGGRNRTQSVSAPGNSKAQLIAAYNELGKELSDTRMRVVGNYNIGRVIGEGSYGKVRLGTHRLTGTRVALKQIPKGVSAQLTREIHHHRQLHHPHVVQLYEVIATETSIWLVTELCTGGELFDYLVEKGRIDEYETRALFGQLCLAVAYCHDEGVVHRDLKLENVLLDDHCHVKLSDFGFTREFERGGLLETFCGTTGYASPEMLLGQKYLGQEVDIWSLGIILYALLTGTLPFDDDDEQEMKNKITAGEYEDPDWLSHEARDLIRGILVQDPLKRLSMQQILSSPWFSKRLYPSSPPPTEAVLSPTPMEPEVEAEGEPSRPASVILELSGRLSTSESAPAGRLSTSSNPGRPITPTNINGVSEDGVYKTLGREDRRNSTNSIAPPLPTRTPVRTKRRSVSSQISPPTSPKLRSATLTTANGAAGVEGEMSNEGEGVVMDFVGAMTRQVAVVFSTPQERAMLSTLAALGFDTGQIVHSVLSDACDSAGALWWIMRKKVGRGFVLPDELSAGARTGNVVVEPLLDLASLGPKRSMERTPSEADGEVADAEQEADESIAVIGARPTVLLDEVDSSKKKRRHHADHREEKERPIDGSVLKTPPPDLSVVPATPIAAEEKSKPTGPPSDISSLSPVHVSYEPSNSSPASTPSSSKIHSNKGRSGSISMLQRATTVLGGAAGLVRKKSDENGFSSNAPSIGSIREKERSLDERRQKDKTLDERRYKNKSLDERGKDKDKGLEERRSSSGSGGRLTKSPPPGKISKEAKDREREGSVDTSGVARASSTKESSVATYPGHVKNHSALLAAPVPRRSVTEGGRAASPLVTRDLAKPRNRASILSTFRMWFDDGRRKRKTGSSISTPSNTPAGLLSASSSAPTMGGYFPADGRGSSGMPERPYTPRKRASNGKGSAPRRGGRSHKDKRPSISSRRSSSVNSRRSSVASLASIANTPAALGSVGEYTVYNGVPLSRRMSGASGRSYGAGARTPIEEDIFDLASRPGSAKSFAHGPPVKAGIAKHGKRHSKSSSTSSGGSLGRRVPTRPSSRAETTSPTATKSKAHHRVGSGSSQTRMIKHRVKKPPSINQSLSTSTTEAPAVASTSQKGRRGRSGSLSSVHSGGSSALDDDAEFGGRRAVSPLGNRSNKTGMLTQKKHNGYGTPSGSLGYIASRSSWKRSWGLEPPGWANRAANQGVVIEILNSSPAKGNVRDVFAGGGKSGWAPGTSPPSDGNEDDWSDVDDDVQFAGGLGQLGSALNTTNNNGVLTAANHLDSPLMVFSNSNAGRRTKRVVSPNVTTGQFGTKASSPLPASNSLPSTSAAPVSAPIATDNLTLDRAGSRRGLPAGRSGFRGPAIVEEEEEEEE